MNISSHLKNTNGTCTAVLSTKNQEHVLELTPKPNGQGSRANGGELLCMALASCYCNDIYREAAALDIEVLSVEVEVHAEFGGVGEAAKSVRYAPKVEARAPEADIVNLMVHTDTVAEIHNTLRKGMRVEMESMQAVSRQ